MSVRHTKYSYTAKKKHRKKIVAILLLIVFIFIIYNLITKYLVRSYRIASNAMTPEIETGQLVLATPMYNPQKNAKRGALVIVNTENIQNTNFFHKTLNSILNFFSFKMYENLKNKGIPSTKLSVRRIIGLPGDTIYMEDFIAHIKTRENKHFLTEFEVTEKNYNLKIDKLPKKWDKKLPFAGAQNQINLKENQYFVLCDNRIISDDSRFWGIIEGNKDIEALVLLKYWQFSEFKIYK